MGKLQLLIDMAREKVGTDAALCRRLGVPGHHVNEWRKGTRAMSPECVAMLCDVLQLTGEEAREWVAIALIENPKNAGKAELLRRALFACWALGAALVPLPKDAKATEADASMIASTESLKPQTLTRLERTVYTLSRFASRVIRAIAAALRLPAAMARPAGSW